MDFSKPEKTTELVIKTLFLSENPVICKEKGSNFGKVAESVHNKSILCRKLDDVVEKVS